MYFNPPRFPINEMWQSLSHRELRPRKRDWLIKVTLRSCGLGDDYNKRFRYCLRFCHNDFDINFVSYLQGLIESKLFRLNQERMKYADAMGKTVRLYRTNHVPLNLEGIYKPKGSFDSENNIYTGGGERISCPGRPKTGESKETYKARHAGFERKPRDIAEVLNKIGSGFKANYGTNSKIEITPDFNLSDPSATRGDFFNTIRQMYPISQLDAASKNIKSNHLYKKIDSDWLINYLNRGRERFAR